MWKTFKKKELIPTNHLNLVKQRHYGLWNQMGAKLHLISNSLTSLTRELMRVYTSLPKKIDKLTRFAHLELQNHIRVYKS